MRSAFFNGFLLLNFINWTNTKIIGQEMKKAGYFALSTNAQEDVGRAPGFCTHIYADRDIYRTQRQSPAVLPGNDFVNTFKYHNNNY